MSILKLSFLEIILLLFNFTGSKLSYIHLMNISFNVKLLGGRPGIGGAFDLS